MSGGSNKKPPELGGGTGATGEEPGADNLGDAQELSNKVPELVGESHDVGGGFSVQFFSGPKIGILCEWSPHMPAERDEWCKVNPDKYVAARDSFLADLYESLPPGWRGILAPS